MSEIENESQIILALQDLATRIETLIDKQEELAENINKIKEAVYNPDEGLYARLNRLDARILGLESWKNNNLVDCNNGRTRARSHNRMESDFINERNRYES